MAPVLARALRSHRDRVCLLVGAATLVAWMLAASHAVACPSCPTTDKVRWIVFGAGFWSNLAIAFLPFIIIGVLAFFAHGIGRRSRAA
jgi:hypothetical protein